MKHCPACDFNFPDFHLICDFDGADLVPETEPSIDAPRTSRLRVVLKSPFFLIVVLGIALLGSAILVGYLDSVSQSASTVGPQSTAHQ